MEKLIIRFGAIEGPRNPTAPDIRKALEDIESGICQRPEFSIEKVSNWKSDVIDGRRVIRCVLEGRYATAATFYQEGSETPFGWVVLIHDENMKSFALSSGGSKGSEFLEGICCGGPLKIHANCVVPIDVALGALTYFVERGDCSPNHEWIPGADAHRFDGR